MKTTIFGLYINTFLHTTPTLHVLIAHLLIEVQCLIEGQDLPQVISDILVSDSVSMILL